jgi:hypothetical protein
MTTSEPMRSELASREAVLKLLSDEETARVSMAETKTVLAEGSDYVDLEHLEKGVQCASAAVAVMMGGVIPRTTVSDQTWSKILAHLAQ